MHARAHRLAYAEQFFVKFDARVQIADCPMPRNNFLDRRRSQQPGCQRLLARSRPRRAQKFKQRSPTKDVQIACVWMSRIEESSPGLSGSCPAILNACDTSLVELDCALLSPESVAAAFRASMAARQIPPQEPAAARGT